MAVLYSVASDTITVTGYSLATPCDLETIRLADVAGGWGQVTKQGSDQYLIDAHTEIGTGIQTVVLDAAGYTNCVAADIGKMVQKGGVDAGILHDYDNGTRTWEVITNTIIASGLAMTIPTGAGAGTASADSTYSAITGWFADEAKQLVLGNRREWRIKTEGHCRFGELLDEDEGTVANSCGIFTDLTGANDGFRIDGELEWYGGIALNSTRNSGMFYISPDNDTYKLRLWNVMVSEFGYTYEYGSFGATAKNWRRGTISNNMYGLNLTTGAFPPEHFNDTVVQGCDYGIRNTWLGYYQNDVISVRNLWIKDTQTKDFMCFNWGKRGYQTIILNAVGYVDCIPTDIGENVYDDGANRGILLSYDNGTRTWTVRSQITIGAGSAMTIPSGAGAGTNSADSTFTAFTANFYAINAICSWTIYWSGSVDAPSKLHRQYSFNLKIVDEDGADVNTARVRCWDKDSNLLFDVYTNASGKITEQIIEYGYYHPDGLEVIEKASPHTIKISKTGYNDIDFIGDIDEPIDWTLTLTDPCYPWTVDKINDKAAAGYDHTHVADYPMLWNNGAKLLTIWGESGGVAPMGYDADHPIDFEHVWAFLRYTKGTCAIGDKFVFNCKLQIGKNNIETHFTDTSKAIIILDSALPNSYDTFIKIHNNATVIFGELISGADKTCWKGCVFQNQATKTYTRTFHIPTGYNNTELYIYSSMLKNHGNGSSGEIYWAVQNEDNTTNVFRIWDSISDGGFVQGSTDAYRLTHKKTSHGFYKPSGSIDDILIYNNWRGAVSYNPPAEITFKNLVLRNNQYSMRALGMDEDTFMIDCVMDNWNIAWEGGGNTARFYRQYSFNLKVIDNDNNGIGGVNVVLTDKDGNPVFNIDTALPYSWWDIPTKNCPEHLENVAPYTVATTDDTDDWTISFRTYWDGVVSSQYAYDTRYGRFIVGIIGTTNGIYIGAYHDIGLFAAGMHSYSVVSNGTHLQCYRDGVAIDSPIASTVDLGGTKRWASRYNDTNPWHNSHNKGCVHTEELSLAQVGVLHTQMAVETGETGTITEQIVNRGYYDVGHGSTLQEYSPHTIQLRKEGYQTYKKKFLLDGKQCWIIRLYLENIIVDEENIN